MTIIRYSNILSSLLREETPADSPYTSIIYTANFIRTERNQTSDNSLKTTVLLIWKATYLKLKVTDLKDNFVLMLFLILVGKF